MGGGSGVEGVHEVVQMGPDMPPQRVRLFAEPAVAKPCFNHSINVTW